MTYSNDIANMHSCSNIPIENYTTCIPPITPNLQIYDENLSNYVKNDFESTMNQDYTITINERQYGNIFYML